MHELDEAGLALDANLPVAGATVVARVGIVGGGQLARMTAMSALKLGCDVVVLERNAASPAAHVAMRTIIGDWNDPAVLLELASQVDVVTLENEFVDAEAVSAVERAGFATYPRAETLALVQDKFLQKSALERAGIPVQRARAVADLAAVHDALAWMGMPAVLKARRNAYDGRGNATIRSPEDVEPAWTKLGGDVGRALYLEEWCPFACELAAIVTRGRTGEMATYPVVETVHRNHICHLVRAPAPVSTDTAQRAADLCRRTATAVGAVGSFGIELFLLPDGTLVVNEVAPRVHNSGHYTTEACACSQFENHVRAVLGIPLGSPRMITPAAVMVNLLGTQRVAARPTGLNEALAVPGASVHLYGKLMSGVGRKLGHVTALGDSLAEAEATAIESARRIGFGAPA